jgi:hypothetical protein
MRFSIRDVIWLTAVAAIGLGSLVDHSIQRARADLRAKDAQFRYAEMLRLRQLLNEKLPGWEASPEAAKSE